MYSYIRLQTSKLDYFHFVIVIIEPIIHPKIKVTISQKCCRGTVQRAMSDVCSYSNSNDLRSHVQSYLKDALNSSVNKKNIQ